ncbi:hypothetical protein BT93_L0088 [Corymbia citriodora subsp. variegata]|uniref:Uncharacterized protein n=1 Tax=Corymbia citriodora subsp. variegata TaxID=360336 RepID=A0A8T0CQL1_CORYI|nr:hypothetical protein BT93_L0088 [Corymbia citriodora subsp. variegata]
MASLYLLSLLWTVLYKITQNYFMERKKTVITNHAMAKMISHEARGGIFKVSSQAF